jgi:hypothetical protein
MNKIPLEIESKNILNIPVAKVGKWYRNNRVISFTMKDLKSMVDNFKKRVLSFNPFLTYGHLVDTASIDSHRKKGDILDLYIKGNTLWAKAITKEDTYESILKGEYEHSSGEFILDYTNPNTGMKTGAVLLRLALTNSPFLPLGKIEALSLDVNDNIEVFSIQVDVPKVIMENIEEVNPIKEPLEDSTVIEVPLEQSKEPEPITEVQIEASLDSKVEEFVVKSTSKAEPLVKEELLTKEELKVEPPVEVVPQSPTSKEDNKENLSISPKEKPNKKKNMPQISDPTPNEINIQSLVDSLKTQLEATYAAQLERLSIQNESLVKQLEAKETQVEELSVQAKTQSLSLSATHQQMLHVQDGIFEDYLIANGAPPVIINKAKELRNAILAGDNIIKLSNDEGQEVEYTYSQYISDLVVSALKIYPIEPSQTGVSRFSITNAPFDSNGSHLFLNEIIRRNKEKVNK